MPKSPQRWIVLPPCTDFEFWNEALQAAASKAQLSFAHVGHHTAETDLVLTFDADLPLSVGNRPEQMVAIISLAGPLANDVSNIKASPQHHDHVKHASELTRRAYAALPGRCYRADEIAARPVPLFDDLILHCPDAVVRAKSPRNRALVAAMEVYHKDRLTWSADLLDIAAKLIGGTATSRAYDLTGKPRFAVHGPYIVMPAGHWQATYRLTFGKGLCEKNYRVDWGGVPTYSELVFSPDKPGLYEIKMDWTFEQAEPCEMRLLALEGIFDGVLTLHDIELQRLS